MKTVRIVGTVFLGLALLIGLIGMFTPTGEAWIERGTGSDRDRVLETFGIWGVSTETDGATAPPLTVERGWYDTFWDGTGGITYLRAAPVFMIISLLLTVTALILTSMPTVRNGVSGGVVAIFAFLGIAGGVGLHTAGLMLRADQFFGTSGALLVRYGLFLLALAILLLFVAMLLGMRVSSEARTHDTHRHDHGHSHGVRRLMCPHCNTVNEAEVGTLPTCYSCGFSGA